jgi:hypothetical protein
MLKFELRQMFRSNGLIDDVVVFGIPEDYVRFSERVAAAVASKEPVVLRTASDICVEISRDDNLETLFTSLQNENDEYISMNAWNTRNILRVVGSERTLVNLSTFLLAVSGRGVGYSYISEFAEGGQYSGHSPEWRLHVQSAVLSPGASRPN